MTWHPLTLCIWLVDGLTWLVYLSAAWHLLSSLPGWDPVSADRHQLRREHHMTLAEHQGRMVISLQAVSYLLLLLGISMVWPDRIPGAMCGTGVLQAMGPSGMRMLIFRGLALVTLYCWLVVQGLEDQCREHTLSLVSARILLAAGPLMALGAMALPQAMAAVQTDQPVSCCAAVYFQLGFESGGQGTSGIATVLSAGWWAAVCLTGALLVVVWGWHRWRRPLAAPAPVATLAGLGTLIWIPVAVIALKYAFSPYIYEVLAHPCPWCLFLGEHRYVGLIYFGLLALILTQTLTGMVARRVVKSHPDLAAIAGDRLRRSGLCLMVGTACFAVFAAAPAVLWRIRFGGWIF